MADPTVPSVSQIGNFGIGAQVIGVGIRGIVYYCKKHYICLKHTHNKEAEEQYILPIVQVSIPSLSKAEWRCLHLGL